MKRIVLIVIGLFLLLGCAVRTPTIIPAVLPTSLRATVTVVAPAATLTPTNKPVVTPVPLSTPTPVVSPTFSGTPVSKIVQNCLTVSDQEVPLLTVAESGTVLTTTGWDDPWMLINLQTASKYKLPLTKDTDRQLPLVGLRQVSPNKNFLAYTEFTLDNSRNVTVQILRVVDSKGNLLATEGFTRDQIFNDWRWLDNERLEIFFLQDQMSGKVSLFNPFTKQWQSLTEKFPNFYQDFDLHPSQWWVDYNPNLEWAVYLGQIEPDAAGPVVFDILADKPIWQATGYLWGLNVPQWSPSGQEVAVVVEGKLYRINRSGRAIAAPLSDDDQVMVFSWSPNERYIAMLVRYKEDAEKGRLMVYDIPSNQVIDYCYPSNVSHDNNPPLWSTDSQQLIYNILFTNTDILVDIPSNMASKLKDINVLAWMNSIK